MNEDISKRIGKELFKIRIDHDYSIEDLSIKSALNKDTLYRYEKGNGNNFDTLAKILNVYGINFYIFFKQVYDNMQNKKEE